MRRSGEGFPAGYREDYSARMAVFDIEQMEALADDAALGLNLYVRSTVEHAVLSALPGLSKDATVHTPSCV